MNEKKLLFSLTAKDFIRQTYNTGGRGGGGQRRNAKENGVRFIHEPSGAVAQHDEDREQTKNAPIAFKKLCNTEKFKKWHKAEVSRRLGKEQLVKDYVDDAMKAKNLRIEVKNEQGKWEVAGESIRSNKE